ncbi:hypothetical protein Tco_0342806 [Tanacetum coccineum]
MAKKDLLHAREQEQKKEIGSTCTPEWNQDQQLHLTELKQQYMLYHAMISMDKSKITRKQSKTSKHEKPKIQSQSQKSKASVKSQSNIGQ